MTPEEIWNRALADMRDRLDEVRQSLRDGDTSDLARIAAPVGLPALPQACADAARRVVDQQRELEGEVRRQLDLRSADLPGAAQRPAPVRRVRFDARA